MEILVIHCPIIAPDGSKSPTELALLLIKVSGCSNKLHIAIYDDPKYQNNLTVSSRRRSIDIM